MNNALLIFVGAGLGGVFRYGVSNGTHWFLGRQFPYGTLAVNASGCFLMGLFYVLILEKLNDLSLALRSFLLIGFLGGYTTFSSFTLETLNLFENGDLFKACLNVILSVCICLLLTGFGIIFGKQL